MNKVSIALCIYNGAKFLPDQLESFLSQTRLPDEVIICDDCSSDESLKLAEEFARKADFTVKVFRNRQNIGLIKNFEKAISLCCGDIIFLSDQDDVWMPQKIELILKEFEKSSEVGLVFSNAELVDEQLTPIGLKLSDITYTEKIGKLEKRGKFFEELLKRNYITGSTAAFRSIFREKLLPFPEDIPELIHDAWIAFVIYVLAEHTFIKEPLVKYRQHSSQQLGLLINNPLSKLSRDGAYDYVINVNQTEIERVEKILNEFRARPSLSEKLPQIEPAALRILEENQETIKHLKNRQSLLYQSNKRISSVWREYRSGRYSKYSGGLKSVAKDLLTVKKTSDLKTVFKKITQKIAGKIKGRQEKYKLADLYGKWISAKRKLDAENHNEFLEKIQDSDYKPLISIVMPVYNTDEKWLRPAIESVLAQSYSNWELCIADDNSAASHIKPILREYEAKDSRIKVIYRTENGHISAASNSALSLASGDFVALLDHDDTLAPDALLFVVREILDNPKVALIYTDEDKIDEKGNRFDAAFKPNWSEDLLYSLNLVTHLAVFRRDILTLIGGFRQEVEGSQDYDLVLRFVERINSSQIRHIPRILYHWRAIQGSVALASDQKDYAHTRAREAIYDHLNRQGIDAKVTSGFAEYHRVLYALPDPLPKVSVIIRANKLDDALLNNLKTVLQLTAYKNFEILVGTNADLNKDFERNLAFYDDKKQIKFISLKTTSGKLAFQLDKIARSADGEILVFAESNLVPLDEDWLRELASHAYRQEIGAAGAKVLYGDYTVRSAGYILGVKEICGRAHHLSPRDSAGNFARLQVINNFSAVSIECLAVKREDFIVLNGFDTKNFPDNLFDVDFCLRLIAIGKRNLLTPYAELIQTQPSPEQKISEIERKNLAARWREKIEDDPFYNPNLTRQNESFQIEFPPRVID